jgi:hypothetical protein
MPSNKKKSGDAGFYNPDANDARGPKARAVEMEKAGLKTPVPVSAASKVATPPKQKPKSAGEKKPAKSPLPAFDAATEIKIDPNLSADASLHPDLANMSDEERLALDIARIRAGKNPFGGLTQKLALPKVRGYYTHWFNDDPPGRIQEQIDRGWSNRLDEGGKPIKRIVGRGRDGSGLYAYAMKIPDVFRDEEMERRTAEAQSRMDQIKKNPFDSEKGRGISKPSDKDKFYSVGDPLTVTSGT